MHVEGDSGMRAEMESLKREPREEWPRDGLEWLGHCPLCGSADRVLLHKGLTDRVFFCAPGTWTLYECRGCRVAYLDPRPTPETVSLAYSSYFTHNPAERPPVAAMSRVRRWQRAVANGYRNWRYGTREWPASRLGVALAYLRPRARGLMDLEFRHLPRAWPGARVLDVGSGDGTFLQWAAAAGWEAVGVDPDPVAVATARKRGLNVHSGTVSDLQVERSSFDVVTLSHVIEHVHDPRALLERIRQLLKPGGLLWLDTPNISSPGHQRFGPAWLGLDPPRHLVLFNHRTLGNLLDSLGLAALRRLPRPDVGKLTYTVSERIAAGHGNPLGPGSVTLRSAIRAQAASWRARLAPQDSEFITLLARRTR